MNYNVLWISMCNTKNKFYTSKLRQRLNYLSSFSMEIILENHHYKDKVYAPQNYRKII